MKQIHFEYGDSETFCKELGGFKKQCESEHLSNLLFHIYTEILETEELSKIRDIIEQVFPEAPYIGCSTSGNIVDSELSAAITVVCTVFELPSTKVALYQYDHSKKSVDDITREIVEETKKHPWVKAIEVYFTIPSTSTTYFCDGLKDLRPDIQIFGGVACSNDITSADSCVFSKGGEYSDKSFIIIFYGGEDFHVDSRKVTGWKPLGRKFHITKSDGNILYELDGIPAYNVYQKYLNIKNDDNFFYNTLEFPLFYEHNGTAILRAPVASNADGSLSMSSNLDVGSVARISYGDPATIVQNIKEDSRKICEFQPDVLHIFSCAARRTFWSSQGPAYELRSLRDIASSLGFFSHGEFLRTKGSLNEHSVTLVIAAMREGEKKDVVSAGFSEEDNLSRVSLVSRLATFISVTSLELEEINQRLEFVNEKLRISSIVDGLTGIYNRKEIQRQIEESLAKTGEEKFSLAMLDIDNFKQVNDTYGHQEGDTVIKALADILRNERGLGSEKMSAGRWGGEEFMLLMRDIDVSGASFTADLIRQCFANTTFPLARMQTVSIGVTQAREGDTIDSLCTRVDGALYKAKKTGKNRVVIL